MFGKKSSGSQSSGKSAKASQGARKKSNILLAVAVVIGLSLLLYPSFSNYWNSRHSTQAISSYVEVVQGMSDTDKEKIWAEAEAYNKDLLKNGIQYNPDSNQKKRYAKCLNVDGSGLMGYIEIAKLNVSLPLYHGTTDRVLQVAVGHLEWSSLPVGGETAHAAFSGHRGLPSAKLFTDLDQLDEGDTFTLNILDETLTYEVDQIRIVKPDELQDLTFEEGKDYCTLVTCTPYGINTHRLLVRGHRVSNEFDATHIVSDAVMVDSVVVSAVLAVPLLIIAVVFLLRPVKRRNRNSNEMDIGEMLSVIKRDYLL